MNRSRKNSCLALFRGKHRRKTHHVRADDYALVFHPPPRWLALIANSSDSHSEGRGWVGSFPLLSSRFSPTLSQGLAQILCQVRGELIIPRCHPLPAWGRVWIEIALAKNPSSPQVFFVLFACEAAKLYIGLPWLSGGLGVFCLSCLACKLANVNFTLKDLLTHH